MNRTLSIAFALCAAPLLHCSGGIDGGSTSSTQVAGDSPLAGLSPMASVTPSQSALDPNVDYGMALRTAAIKLTGNFPTLAEIKGVLGAADPATAYATQIDTYLKDPRFAREQFAFWRNTLRMGTTVGSNNFDAAPAFAAMTVVQDQPITNLFTVKTGTCVQLNADNTFGAASCNGANSGVNAAGILSDPGALAQFYASMAFRRVRWLNEVFVCQKFPVEQRDATMTADPSAPAGYFSPYPFASVSNSPINFQATAIICANCHETINRITPIMGHYDAGGQFTSAFGVMTPITTPRASLITDYLTNPAESPAWRFGKPVANMEQLGQAIAADPNMARCMTTRVWNWAFSRGDVIIDGATLPADLVQQMADSFVASNYNVKGLIRQAVTSPSFIRY